MSWAPPAAVAAWGQSRVPLVAVAMVLALALGGASGGVARRPRGSDRDPDAALRRELELRFGLTVRAGDLAWERPPEVGLAGALWGTRLVFLAAPRQGSPRDLYRTEVRRAPGGRIVSLAVPTNLTRTPIGDETGLLVRWPWVAFAARAYERVQAVEVLDLRGEPSAAVGSLDAVGRLQLALTDRIDTGDAAGLGRTIVRLDGAPSTVTLAWRSASVLEITPPEGSPLAIDVARARVLEGRGGTAELLSHDPKPTLLWAVDTVRSLVGPRPIAWLEARTFAVADLGRRLSHGSVAQPPAADVRAPPAGAPAGVVVGWPPPAIAPRLQPQAPGEGQWSAKAPAFIKRLPDAPPAFYETFLRPDPARPYVRVVVVAMDLRQLALGVVAGAEDPEPTVGPPGTGKLPRRREVVDNLVAAFNGAFKTKHGKYGMVEDRRILLPPMRSAASIVARTDGRVGIGTWPGDWHVPDDVVSLRQNLDPLVDRGVLNPSRRRLWGFPLPGMDAMQTHRSGLCVDRGGSLLYFFGADLSGPLLGEAMLSASCSYGIHLDMNPWHCAFVYARIHDPDRWLEVIERPAGSRRSGALAELYEAQTAARGMMDPKRYLVRSPKDFFYLTLRPTMLEDPSYRLDGGTL